MSTKLKLSSLQSIIEDIPKCIICGKIIEIDDDLRIVHRKDRKYNARFYGLCHRFCTMKYVHPEWVEAPESNLKNFFEEKIEVSELF